MRPWVCAVSIFYPRADRPLIAFPRGCQITEIRTDVVLSPHDHADFFNTLDAAGLEATVDEWMELANTHRFNAPHWRAQLKAMLEYDAYAGRGSVTATAALIQAKVLSVTCVGDACVDPGPQQELAAAIPRAKHVNLSGSTGHLNFFTEMEALTQEVASFMQS